MENKFKTEIKKEWIDIVVRVRGKERVKKQLKKKKVDWGWKMVNTERQMSVGQSVWGITRRQHDKKKPKEKGNWRRKKEWERKKQIVKEGEKKGARYRIK